MKIKSGANIQGINIAMQPVFIAAEAIWKDHGQELVITAGLDGEHSAGSLHYYGFAVDLRTRYFDTSVHSAIAEELRARLGNKYDVIVHDSHIHVEFDAGKLSR